LAFETEALDNPDGERRDREHHLAQHIPRQMQHGTVDGSGPRPDMQALLENLGAADEIAGMPVGKGDFAPDGAM
jgi:hypothetical protein